MVNFCIKNQCSVLIADLFLLTGVSEACTMKVENESLVSQGPQSQDSAPHPRIDSKSTSEQVTTKQEEQEEPVDGVSFSLGLVKMEDLSQEDMGWKTKVPDEQNQHPNQLSSDRLDPGKKQEVRCGQLVRLGL